MIAPKLTAGTEAAFRVSCTRSQEAMRRVCRIKRDLTGNFPGLPAIYPDTMAPVVCRRAIMLTDRELEPYFVYERTAKEFDIKGTTVSFEDMAIVTDRVFFQNLRREVIPPNGVAPGEETG